jgi:hypothetical protein
LPSVCCCFFAIDGTDLPLSPSLKLVYCAVILQRPQWVAEQLEPKLGGSFSESAGDGASKKQDLDKARELHKSRVYLLAALSKQTK